MPRLVVMLPCFNEEQALPPLLAAFAPLVAGLPATLTLTTLVVDDGSTDGTARAAETAAQQGQAVVLLRHPENLGLGAALRSGIEWFAAHCQSGDLLAAMDADLTHPPELLLAMLCAAERGADVVIASRYAPGGSEHGLSALRRVYSRGACLLLGAAARILGVRDYTCGFRLYTYEVLARGLARYGEGLVTERSFVCMAELLCRLAACGAKVSEVPLELHYELKPGASKMNVPVTIRRYVALLGRLLFSHEFRRS